MDVGKDLMLSILVNCLTYHIYTQKSGYWHPGQRGCYSFQAVHRTRLDSQDVGATVGMCTWEVEPQSVERLSPTACLQMKEKED